MLKSYTFTYEMMDWGTQQQQQQGSTQNSTTTSPHHSPNNDHSDGKTYWNKKIVITFLPSCLIGDKYMNFYTFPHGLLVKW